MVLMAMVWAASCTSNDADIDSPKLPPDTAYRPAVVSLPQNRDRFEFPIPRESNIHGYAVVQCMAQLDHKMTDCQAISESPKGYNFAQSAVYIARVARVVRPAMKDGVPVVSVWRAKIEF